KLLAEDVIADQAKSVEQVVAANSEGKVVVRVQEDIGYARHIGGMGVQVEEHCQRGGQGLQLHIDDARRQHYARRQEAALQSIFYAEIDAGQIFGSEGRAGKRRTEVDDGIISFEINVNHMDSACRDFADGGSDLKIAANEFGKRCCALIGEKA